MSLRFKVLLPLNLVIVLVVAAYSWLSHRTLADQLVAAQVRTIEHLAVGLRPHAEHMLKHPKHVADLSATIEAVAQRWGDLDIMILDDQLTVVAATIPARVGRRWQEPDLAAVLAGRTNVAWKARDHAHEGVPVIDVSVAARAPDGSVAFIIHIGRRFAGIKAALHTAWLRHAALALTLLIGVAVVANWLFYRHVLSPLERIHRRIQATDWAEGTTAGTNRDEVARLSAVLDQTLARIQDNTQALESTVSEKEGLLGQVSKLRDGLSEEVERVRCELAATQTSLLRAERLSTLGQLAAGLAHELRNPLHIVRGAAEMAARRPASAGPLLTDIIEEVDRIERLIQELLDYARPVDLAIEAVDRGDLLQRVRNRVLRARERTGDETPCLIEVEAEPGCQQADPMLLEQALLNLLLNACEASEPTTPVALNATGGSGGGTEFTVADRGAGIAAADRSHLFEPFFTRKAHGTGLGLAVVQKVAELHGGSVALEDRPGGGTLARLHVPPCLPRRAAQGDSAPPDTAASSPLEPVAVQRPSPPPSESR